MADVLILEPTRSLCRSMAEELTRAGYSVTRAYTVRDAETALEGKV